jgi:hypothetical protein
MPHRGVCASTPHCPAAALPGARAAPNALCMHAHAPPSAGRARPRWPGACTWHPPPAGPGAVWHHGSSRGGQQQQRRARVNPLWRVCLSAHPHPDHGPQQASKQASSPHHTHTHTHTTSRTIMQSMSSLISSVHASRLDVSFLASFVRSGSLPPMVAGVRAAAGGAAGWGARRIAPPAAGAGTPAAVCRQVAREGLRERSHRPDGQCRAAARRSRRQLLRAPAQPASSRAARSQGPDCL